NQLALLICLRENEGVLQRVAGWNGGALYVGDLDADQRRRFGLGGCGCDDGRSAGCERLLLDGLHLRFGDSTRRTPRRQRQVFRWSCLHERPHRRVGDDQPCRYSDPRFAITGIRGRRSVVRHVPAALLAIFRVRLHRLAAEIAIFSHSHVLFIVEKGRVHAPRSPYYEDELLSRWEQDFLVTGGPTKARIAVAPPLFQKCPRSSVGAADVRAPRSAREPAQSLVR